MVKTYASPLRQRASVESSRSRRAATHAGTGVTPAVQQLTAKPQPGVDAFAQRAVTPPPWQGLDRQRPSGATPEPIQADSRANLKPYTEIHAAAQHGTSGAGGALPHLETIQRAFGRHDVSGVVAHTDTAAAQGSTAMGAEAFTMGNHVAFAGTPSLHTAAHEAAHAIQQQAGVQLLGGVGQVGDQYEQHADLVADRVVQGQAAEDLLDAYAGGPTAEPTPAGGGSVQSRAIQQMATSRLKLTQSGGTCGLYSLGMAISAIDGAVKEPALMEGILSEAVKVGTFVGEYMDADMLCAVAKGVGYTSSVVDFGDLDDMTNKLDGTGKDGVLMAYSAFDTHGYAKHKNYKHLDQLKHLFSHWSVVEDKDATDISIRDPNDAAIKKVSLKAFHQANQDAASKSAEFDFQEFQDEVGQSVSGLHTTFTNQLPKSAKPAALPKALPKVKLNLKGKIIKVSK